MDAPVERRHGEAWRVKLKEKDEDEGLVNVDSDLHLLVVDDGSRAVDRGGCARGRLITLTVCTSRPHPTEFTSF